jgi:hypothetical protein
MSYLSNSYLDDLLDAVEILRDKNYETALPLLSRIAQCEMPIEDCKMIAFNLFECQDIDHALIFVNKGMAITHLDYDLNFLASLIHFRRKDFCECVRLHEVMIELRPEVKENKVRFGIVLMMAKQPERAVEIFSSCIQEGDDDITVLNYLMWSLEDCERWDEASKVGRIIQSKYAEKSILARVPTNRAGIGSHFARIMDHANVFKTIFKR